MIIYICTSEILKTRVLNRFLVHNIHLYLCRQVEDAKWILCYRKTDVKCMFLRFLMHKYVLYIRNLKCAHLTPVFRLHNIHLVSSTYQQKYK